jgi:isopentenyl-diphosphate delta-isomerase
MVGPGDIERRKREHLELCAGTEVEFREKTSLLEEVELVHCALPEMRADDVDSSLELLGKNLGAPLLIAGMTGGTDEAARINRDLARVAQDLGIGFGLGSQRAMFEDPEKTWTFQVREQAPDVLLLGNLGLVQAREMTTDQIKDLCARVGADALCIHLNPAMEVVQPGGDGDFTGGLDLLRRLVDHLDLPVVAKETGCGISRGVGQMLRSAGITHVDVGGAGGTSWVAVETLRATDQDQRQLGDELWDWGIPTAASVLQLGGLGLRIIATGGLRTGLDVARAVALGASACGLAGPVLRVYSSAGPDGAKDLLRRTVLSLRRVMLLTGSRTLADLQRAPRLLGPTLSRWEP